MNVGSDRTPTSRGGGPGLPSICFCPDCGAIGYEGEEFCFFCGHGLSRLPVGCEQEGRHLCGNCNALLPHPVACYCGRCGEAVDREF